MSSSCDHIDPFMELTRGRELPEGADHWAIRTKFARNGFTWPATGWIEAPGPLLQHDGDGPLANGDGLCVAYSWAGMATGQYPADVLLLVAYANADRLSTGEFTTRLARACVVEEIDGLSWVREHGLGVDFARANFAGCDLREACLYGANLAGANLVRTNLAGASLRGADLAGANLRNANLTGADLYYADLTGANLAGAMVDGNTKLGSARMQGLNAHSVNLFVATF